MGNLDAAPARVPAAAQRSSRDTATPRPRVSVVVPVLNGEAFLRESLDSILEQTYRPSEVIVMDDGSTDSTSEIGASYGDRVRYVRQASTRGIYGNANDGIALASGELIGVLHADDAYLPEMLEREVEWLERHPEAAVVFCSDIFIDGDGRELGRLELPPDIRGGQPLHYATVLNTLLSYTNTFLRCQTALVRASVYEELGGYRDDVPSNATDLEMWLRILRRYPIGVLEEYLAYYRRGHGSSSERFHRLRTRPSRVFDVIDDELAAGGKAAATQSALRDYEAHRAVDAVLRVVNHYILGDRDQARAVLQEARLRVLARSGQIERGRMLALTLALRILLRFPRAAAIARLFERRWYGGSTAAAGTG